MKKLTIVAGLLVLLPVFSAQAKPHLTGCAAKEQDIKQQIDQAHKHNNQRRVDGLQKALHEVHEHCTDESLRRERLSDVQEKEHEVAQRLRDLDEAKKSGNPHKIEKRKTKLKEARQELADAKAELSK